MKCLLALILLLPPPLSAQSRFNGTWEMKMDTIELSGPPEEYVLQDGMYHCITCVPRVDVRANGSIQRLSGHSGFDSITVRVIDARSVAFTQFKGGLPIFACTETVSPDDTTMTEEFSETPSIQRVTGHATFTRVAHGPSAAHALSGSWQMRTIRNVAALGPMTTYEIVQNGLKVSEGSYVFEAKFDGKDYPVKGQPNQQVSLTLIDANAIERVDKTNRKVVRIDRITVAKDGKSMRVESDDKVRGSTMTFTAEKRD
jgi:hypothetical protein